MGYPTLLHFPITNISTGRETKTLANLCAIVRGVIQLKFHRNKRSVADERVGRKLVGLRVVNSYRMNEDSTYKYFEVILVDVEHNVILNDPRINWICNPVYKHMELRDPHMLERKTRVCMGPLALAPQE
ncbi:hypothetical protein V6N13_140549 [Hibiscus sabdariffa]